MNRVPQRELRTARTWTVDETDELFTSDRLVDSLKEKLLSPSYEPPMLPAVAKEAMTLAAQPDVELTALAKVLEKDPLLTTRVLQVCRSPLYATAMELRSMKAAVVSLGIKRIRNIVMEVSVASRVFRCPQYGMALERLARHGSVVALLSKTIARFTTFDPEWAYLCGLLHDVGFSAALVAVGDVPKGTPARPVDEVWMAASGVHEAAAGVVARRWDLPVELSLVLANHHQVAIDGVAHPMAAVVCLADELAFRWGEGPQLPSPDHTADAPTVAGAQLSRSTLGLTDDRHYGAMEKACREALKAVMGINAPA